MAGAEAYSVLAAIVCLQVLQSEVARRTEQAAACPPLLLCYVNHAAALVLLPSARGRLAALRRAAPARPSLVQLAVAATGANALLLASDWCFYRGLAPGGLSVGVGSALFNSQLCWAVAFSACGGAPARGGARRRWASAAAAVLAMCGVVLLSRDLGAAAEQPPSGARRAHGGADGRAAAALDPSSVAACLGSALLYAAFEVAYKRSALAALGARFADASCATACVGLAHVLTVTPALVALRAAGRLPLGALGAGAAGELALNAALALAYNAALNLAIARCSPVAVSAASVLAAPAALACDLALGLAPGLRLEAAGGALLVVVAGAVIVAAEAEPPRAARAAEVAAGVGGDVDAALHARQGDAPTRGWPRWLGGGHGASPRGGASAPLVDAAAARAARDDDARAGEPIVWVPETRQRLPRAATAPSLVAHDAVDALAARPSRVGGS